MEPPLASSYNTDARQERAGGRRMSRGTGDGLRVMVVDDSRDFLDAVSSWIVTQPGLVLAGTAGDGSEAETAVEVYRPDVVLMDAFMPRVDGFEATRRLKSAPAPPLVVVLSVHEGSAIEREALAAGADAFLPKAELSDRLPPLLAALIDGRSERPTGTRPTAGSTGRPRGKGSKSPNAPIERRRVAPESMARLTKFRRALARLFHWVSPRMAGEAVTRMEVKEEGSMRSWVVRTMTIAAVAILAAAPAVIAAPPGKPSLTGLGETFLIPMDMSADGSVVVGRGFFGTPTFRYTAAEGVQILDGGCGSGQAAVSGDGTTIVSCIIQEDGAEVAAKWLGGTSWQPLGSVEGAVRCDANLSSAWDVNHDGTTAVGLAWLAQLCRAHAGAWDLRSGPPAIDLGSLVPNSATRANAISGDGRTIAGWQDDEFGQRQGAVWRDGVEEPVLTAGGDHVGEVAFVNFDGTVMAGSNLPYGSPNAWVWSERRGFTAIEPPSQLWSIFVAAASADGSLVAGVARTQTGLQKAWIWKAQGGKFLWVADYLAKNGLGAGWEPSAILSISSDGKTLAGWGFNPDGQIEGFLIENLK